MDRKIIQKLKQRTKQRNSKNQTIINALSLILLFAVLIGLLFAVENSFETEPIIQGNPSRFTENTEPSEEVIVDIESNYCQNTDAIADFLRKYELKEVDDFNQLTICMAGDSIFGRQDKGSAWNEKSPEISYTPDTNDLSEVKFGYQTGHFPPNMWVQTIPYKTLELFQWDDADVKYFNHNAAEVVSEGDWIDAYPVPNDNIRAKYTSTVGANMVFTFTGATHLKVIFPGYSTATSRNAALIIKFSTDDGITWKTPEELGLVASMASESTKSGHYKLPLTTYKWGNICFKGFDENTVYKVKVTNNSSTRLSFWGFETWSKPRINVVVVAEGGNTAASQINSPQRFYSEMYNPSLIIYELPYLNDLGSGAITRYMGKINPSSSAPVSPTVQDFYYCSQTGLYTYFGGIYATAGEYIEYDGTNWKLGSSQLDSVLNKYKTNNITVFERLAKQGVPVAAIITHGGTYDAHRAFGPELAIPFFREELKKYNFTVLDIHGYQKAAGYYTTTNHIIHADTTHLNDRGVQMYMKLISLLLPTGKS